MSKRIEEAGKLLGSMMDAALDGDAIRKQIDRKVYFEKAKLKFIALRAEWQELGFWARIRRAREFRARFDTVLVELRAFDPRRTR